ncbi:MAG: RloB family protein [Thiobacillus sp.]
MAQGIVIAPRRSGFRSQRKLVLIVCEGERTEPSYFEDFPLSKNVCEVRGAGANTLSVVQEAIEMRNKGNYNEVWCVFDRDSFPVRRIQSAFDLAEKEKIKIAFSNESFELWYLLHYQYLDTAIPRADYCKKLAVLLGGKYAKNDSAMYRRLLPLQATAIRHARKLHAGTPAKLLHSRCPATTVYELVERLNKLSKAR